MIHRVHFALTFWKCEYTPTVGIEYTDANLSESMNIIHQSCSSFANTLLRPSVLDSNRREITILSPELFKRRNYITYSRLQMNHVLSNKWVIFIFQRKNRLSVLLYVFAENRSSWAVIRSSYCVECKDTSCGIDQPSSRGQRWTVRRDKNDDHHAYLLMSYLQR